VKPFVEIELLQDSNPIKVKIKGEISSFTLDKVREFFSQYTEIGDDIHIDMSELNYIDSSGIGFLILVSEKLRKFNKKLKILNPSPNLQNLFKLIHLGKIVEIVI